MKAAAFDYIRADSLEHALALLVQHGSDAKLLAGGQSLIPMMAMRLARPALLIDINRLVELKTLSQTDQNIVTGAGMRQCEIADAHQLDTPLPLLRQALRWVGHVQTRNRGTVGGSLVHADPSAELALAALVMDATLHLESQAGGERQVSAPDFFLGPMFTAVAETECLLSIDWPIWKGGRTAAAFEETSIRHGDFAIASAACQIQLKADGTVLRASFGLGGVSGSPLVFPELAQRLIGQQLAPSLVQEVAQAAAQECDPGSDMHASAEYRRHLAVVLLSRVLLQAGLEAAQ